VHPGSVFGALQGYFIASATHQGWHFLFIRQYERAIEPLQKTIELDPNSVLGRSYLGLVNEQQGGFEDASTQFSECVRITGRRPSMVALLGHAYAVANRRSEAQAILQQLSARSKEQYVPPYPIAVVHAGLGETDEAFAWLEKAFEERDSWLNYVALDPRLDRLRQDSRCGNLLRRLKLAR
jgi:Flp pilus assembly protein TadD